jgi:hypothetical protein
MNRYDGRTGRVERVPEPEPSIRREPPIVVEEEHRETQKPSGQSGILGGLGGLLSKGGLGSLGGLGNLGSSLGGLSGLSGLLPEGGLLGLLPKGGVGGLLSKAGKLDLELEDLMLVGIFYLLYRESKDVEFLLIAGAMLFM